MLISLKKEQLNYCLDTVEKALPVRSNVQSTENILLEWHNDELIFTATNLELDIRVKQPYHGEGSGSILLPPKIVEIVRYLPDPDVELNINWDNFRLDLTSGQASYVLIGADPSDYPLIQDDPAEKHFLELPQPVLKKLLRKIVFAASTDESRPAFNGVLFHFRDKQITFTASDTYRLVLQDMEEENWSFAEQRYLIPAKALRELMKVMGDEGEISIASGGKRVIFRFGYVYFATRVLEEKYPDVRGVIPGSFKTRITTDRKLLEETVNRAGMLAEGINQAVYFSIHDQQLEVKVSSPIGKMEEILQCQQEGESVEVLVNSRFVMDILKVLDHEEILIDFHGKNGPLVFRIPGDSSYLYLVLPIKIE